MSEFDFVFGLISIVTSLALTHIIVGLVSLARRSRRVRFSLRHALWVWAAFALVVANWASYWSQRDQSWTAQSLLISLTLMISLYAFSALVIPEVGPEETAIDLPAFHESESKRYMVAHLVFAALAIISFATSTTSVTEWLTRSSFAWIALALTLAALVARPVWLQQAIASALAALATFFMLVRAEGLGA